MLHQSEIKILSLNCQRAYQPTFTDFFIKKLAAADYDFLLLQEVSDDVLELIDAASAYQYQCTTLEGKRSLVALVYKNSHKLSDGQYRHFESHTIHSDIEHNQSSFGVELGTFDGITIASVHLPSGLQSKNRNRALTVIKELLDDLGVTSKTLLFGGDCNFASKRERAAAERYMTTAFRCVTKDLPPTLDSYYTDDLPYITNRIALWLKKIGIRIRLYTDHVFVTDSLQSDYYIETSLLSDTVSDHSPVTVTLKRK